MSYQNTKKKQHRLGKDYGQKTRKLCCYKTFDFIITKLCRIPASKKETNTSLLQNNFN